MAGYDNSATLAVSSTPLTLNLVTVNAQLANGC